MSSANLLKTVWNWLSPPSPEEIDPVPQREPFPPEKPPKLVPKKQPGKFGDIRTAVESRLNYLVRLEIPEHREIAKRDLFELHYIEVECSETNAATLQSFFKDFSPTARQDWIRDILGDNAVVKLDYFAGIHGSGDLPETGAIDRHEQILSQGVRPTYAVHIWGQWVQQVQTDPPPVQPVVTSGQPVALRIHDSQGQRPEICKETYPLTLGRSGACGVVVVGTFVSGNHCALYSEQGRHWLEDHSKNGTWLDGKKLPLRQRVELTASRHRLRLGKASGEAKDCPEIELEFLEPTFTPVATATPVDTSNATPVIAAAGELLAVLSIQDATGNPMRDVLKLPFTIGRADDRDYTTPPAHAGVSGLHLILEEITNNGVRVSNGAYAKNGTALGDVLQAAEFIWPFDTEIVLAPKWLQAPPVRITLKRP